MKTNYFSTSMLDMVFENRNQEYGAYVLRRDHDKFLLQGLLFTLGTVSMLLLYNFLHDKFHHQTIKHERVIISDVTEVDKLPPVAPPKPPKPEVHARATVANTERRVVHENEAHTDSLPTLQDLERFESGLTTNTEADISGIGVTDGTGDNRTFEVAAPAASEVDNSIHDFTEVMPEFPGGERKLTEFLQRHTDYPSFEQSNEIQGKALVRFVVNQDGSISNAEIIKTDTRGFANEALRVMALVPKFKPGMQAGKPVRVRVVLPFYFKLNN